MANEIWKSIEGWIPYEVSTLGRVRRTWPCYMCHAQRFRILKPHRKPGGYLGVMLQKARLRTGKAWYPSVHLVVAITFLGPKPTPKHAVNHKNGIKIDNRPENLEWVTYSENTTHAIETGLMRRIGGIAAASQKITPEDVRYIRTSDKTNKELARELNLSPEHVGGIRARRFWKHIE